jgi:hypothetical protein
MRALSTTRCAQKGRETSIKPIENLDAGRRRDGLSQLRHILAARGA